jgi:hypothetical protein
MRAGTLFLCMAFAACKSSDANTPMEDGAVAIDDVAPMPMPMPTPDQALLDDIQSTTFRYFWDFGHPVSGMARERSTSNETTTSGGTGFGVAAIVVATERGWVTRADAIARVQKIVTFLGTADRYHGAFAHWINGTTGKTIPFSMKDDGGDIVETAYLIEGLLIARAYFNGPTPEEQTLRDGITALWEAVEWNHYASRGDGLLYWHWSPNYAWQMNLPIRGYNEALITYVLALGSPTHPITPSVYTTTWTHAGYRNRNTYEGYQLPLGPAYGGPLFFEQYTFIGLDPRALEDTHAFYWRQAVIHTLINRDYAVNTANPTFQYSAELWGLTASDNPDGYGAHSPTNDNGTISPTAALSSMPFTPYASLLVARHLKTALAANAYGQYGPVDALNLKRGWFATTYLAIDQGPIISMIENYRTGLLWKLFMDVPEVKTGLDRAGLHAPVPKTGFYLAVPSPTTNEVKLVRHPDLGTYTIDIALGSADAYTLTFEREDGSLISRPWDHAQRAAGTTQIVLPDELQTGQTYVVRLVDTGSTNESIRLVLR